MTAPVATRRPAATLVHGVPVYARHDRPPVEALGVVDGRVRAAGPLAEVRAALPETAVEVRLADGAVLPAFVDPHQHACLVAVDPSVDTLAGCRDVAGLLALIGSLVAAQQEAVHEPAGWLRLHGYEPLRLAEHRSPTAAELDAVVADRPLHVLSRTYHESVVNSAGLEALGITARTPDPPGGLIRRDRRGRPTGVLVEAASFAAEASSRPGPEATRFASRLAAHGRRLLALGVTRIGEAATPTDLAAELVAGLGAVGVDAHPLLVGARIDEPALVPGGTAKVLVDGGEYCHFCLSGRQVQLLLLGAARASFGPDGAVARALGRRSGMPRREADGRWHHGVRYPYEAAFGELLTRAADVEARLAAHAVGNGAVDAVLRAVAAAPRSGPVPLRLEHAMAIDPTQARRLADAGLPVVAQPGFLPAYGHDLSVTPLPAPLRLVPVRSLLDAGVAVSFGTDHPAAALDPWVGVRAAVTRLDDAGRRVGPDEAVTVAQALTAATATAARVLGVTDGGTLEPGMRADLIWCHRDPHRTDPRELDTIRVLATWRAGEQVFGELGGRDVSDDRP